MTLLLKYRYIYKHHLLLQVHQLIDVHVPVNLTSLIIPTYGTRASLIIPTYGAGPVEPQITTTKSRHA
jgi:hypothetical protein